MRKVIYVSVGRLTDKIARDWSIEYLLERGAEVEYWDIVSLVREQHHEVGAMTPPYLSVLNDIGELEQKVRAQPDKGVVYVLLLTYAGQSARIFRLFSKYDCRTVHIYWGAVPADPMYRLSKISFLLVRPWWTARELYYRAKAAMFRKLNLVRPYDIAFAAGEQLLSGNLHANRTVPVNLCDYDLYAEARRRSARTVHGRYAVFLDINLPFQSDLALFGFPAIGQASYFRSLNRFFGQLESQHGIEVVIATHPKASYSTEVFEGRNCFRLLTAELVKDADFVLSHSSTAMSYAVLNVKPLMFIYTGDMLVAYRDTVIREMHRFATYLDAPICNIDSIGTDERIVIRKANVDRYEQYKYQFLTSRASENSSTSEIIWRELCGAQDEQ